jgi:hypothetical protein
MNLISIQDLYPSNINIRCRPESSLVSSIYIRRSYSTPIAFDVHPFSNVVYIQSGTDSDGNQVV